MMMHSTFKVGASIEINNKAHKILRLFDDGRIVLETIDDGSLSNSSRDELLTLYAQSCLKFVEEKTSGPILSNENFNRPLCTFSENISWAAIRRKRYLDFILQLGTFVSSPRTLLPIINECARRLNDPRPPCAISIYRWYTKFCKSGHDNRSLIDRSHLRGGRGRRLKPDVENIIQTSIDSIYLNTQRESVESVHQNIVARINSENAWRDTTEKLKSPSKSTVHRIIMELDQYEVVLARYGKHAAELQFRASGKGPKLTRILQRVEVDHTLLDLFVIDVKTHLPLGRPTVTFMLDGYSKMIMGFHIGFQSTSLESIYRCLRHALMPKIYIRDKYPGIKNDWPCCGVFETLICDNGVEFHSNDLERVAFEVGFHIEFCPKRKPYFKGSIERFLKTLNYKFAHAIPGSSFARWFERGDYDPLKHAVVCLDDLIELVHRWIVDVYSQSHHRGINAIPHHRWRESEAQHPVRLVADPQRLDISLGRTVTRTISHRGIELHGGGMFYNSELLGDIRRMRKGIKQVEVRYFVEDIGHIFVIDPGTQEALFIPATDQEYAKGLSLQQHELIKEHVREINNGLIDIPALAQAKAEIREIISEMSMSKSSRKRQRASKLRGIGRDDNDFLRNAHKGDVKNSQGLRADISESQARKPRKSKYTSNVAATTAPPPQTAQDYITPSNPLVPDPPLKRLGSFLLNPSSSERKTL
jgi:putative transposase